MPLWHLAYKIGTLDRSVEAEFDDLVGNVQLAHDFIRRLAGDEAKFTSAAPVIDMEHGRDQLDGDPKVPLWITYWPYHPDDDPDDESLDQPTRRERFDFPARWFETHVYADGRTMKFGPSIGIMRLAIRRRLADGREGGIRKVDHSEDGN